MDKNLKAISEAYKGQQTIDLCWMTNDGCEWLKKTLIIPEDREEFRKALKQWYKASKPMTVQFLDGWRKEGEDDVSLFATVSNESRNNKTLSKDILTFADTVLNDY